MHATSKDAHAATDPGSSAPAHAVASGKPTHHLYACAKDEPTRRVSMYEVDTEHLESVIRVLYLRPANAGSDDGYYVDFWGGLWWVKTYAGQGT
jgi:hypothetical protein